MYFFLIILFKIVYLYYKLTNFYQNHRKYVKSVNYDQLKGVAASITSLTDCEPLVTDSAGRPYYPCGLIANSQFNGIKFKLIYRYNWWFKLY